MDNSSSHRIGEIVASILIWGGLLTALIGLGIVAETHSMDDSFSEAGHYLDQIASAPIGLWTLKFLAGSIVAAVSAVFDGLMNTLIPYGAFAAAAGFYLQAHLAKSSRIGQPKV